MAEHESGTGAEPVMVTKLWMQLRRARDGGRVPATWLLSRRIARVVVEELRPMLHGDATVTASVGIQDLTQLFGVPVAVVDDLPQGSVLR